MLGVVGRAHSVLEHLEEWMTPASRHTDAALHGTAQAFVQYQPKGVVGNIVPWNFPFDLSVEDFRGGWFHMGDLMLRNPNGTLDFVDRRKYLIKSGGPLNVP